MRMFQPKSEGKHPLTDLRGVRKKKRKALIKAKMGEGYDKAKLRASGLWNEAAARKGTLVITRLVPVGEQTPAK